MSFGAKILVMSARFALTATAAAATLALPNLSGTWRLNRELSDDPAKVLREAEPSDSSGAPTGGWSGRRGRRRGQSTREDSGPDPDWFANSETLRIRHNEPEVSIADAAGVERTLYTDGRKTEEDGSHGGTTPGTPRRRSKVTTRWKDGHVEVVSVPEHGSKIVETYAVTADRKQLTVTTKIERGRRTVTFRRVYDSLPASTPDAAPAAPERQPPAPQSDDDQEEIRVAAAAGAR
jgi:hypothetical protein